MVKITLKIDGMMCRMCESHINDAIRRAFAVKKVSSAHSKGKTEILAEEPIEEEKLRQTINETGYTLVEMRSSYLNKMPKGRKIRWQSWNLKM